MRISRTLSLIVMGAGLVSCVSDGAKAPDTEKRTADIYLMSTVTIYVDSSRHVACYSYAAWQRSGASISCVALDSTNSHAK